MQLYWDQPKREAKRVKRTYEAANWLREMGGGITLPVEPSEEELRLALKSGVILVNLINHIVPSKNLLKVSDNPDENINNAIELIKKLGPTLDASDLEEGGRFVRVVDFVLNLKLVWGKKLKDTGGSGHNDSPDIMPVEVLADKVTSLSPHKMVKLHSKIQELKIDFRSTKDEVLSLLGNYQEELNSGLGSLHDQAQAAACRYQKILEENRKLYNQVQDLKGSIRVYCRVRPLSTGAQGYECHVEDGSVTISKDPEGRQKTLKCNKVFGAEATQEEVFADIQPLVRSVLDGYNVSIIAYGQTGSGKTYTMSGPKNMIKGSEGVNHRALEDLFLLSEERKDIFHYDFLVQMVEIYNETVRDLLDNDKKDLQVVDISDEGIYVPDAKLIHVATRSDVLKQMRIGEKNRAAGWTALNSDSSRSHSCLIVHVRGKEVASGTMVLRGCLNLVDLAGSEDAKKSCVRGDRLKETGNINKSLTNLGKVISDLVSRENHIPYRSSKLTHLLQHSLGGQAKTVMLVHINTEIGAYQQSVFTLKFAESAAKVELGRIHKNNQRGGKVSNNIHQAISSN